MRRRSRKVVCDICGKKINMASGDTIPVHATDSGGLFVHPEHIFRGFPLPVTPPAPTLQERFADGYVPLSAVSEDK